MKKNNLFCMLFVLIFILQACSDKSLPMDDRKENTIDKDAPIGLKEGKVSNTFYDSFEKWYISYKETSTVFKKSKLELLFIHNSTTEEQISAYATEYSYLLKYKNNWDKLSNELLWQTKTPADEAILNSAQNIEYSFDNYLNQSLIFMKNNGVNYHLDSATEIYEQDDTNLKNMLIQYQIYE